MTRRGGITLLAAALLIAVFAAYVIPTSPTSPASHTAPRIKAAACKQDDPSTVTMVSSGTVPTGPFGGDLINLKGCAAKGGHIICNLALTKKTPGIQVFYFDFQDWASDNFKEMHPLLAGAFFNLRCRKIMDVDLDKDDWVWFTQEFDGPTDGVTSVKLLFGNSQLILESPVEAAQ